MDLTHHTIAITARFILAVRKIHEQGISLRAFCANTGIDRRNLRQRMKGGVNSTPISWLSAIVLNYGVSAEWLLTGLGEMFEK